MFLGLAILLAVIYVISLLVVHTAPFFIHLLIIFAVISLVAHLLTGRKAQRMFLALALFLAVLWVVCFVFVHVAPIIIKLLLILAVISLVMHFFQRRPTR